MTKKKKLILYGIVLFMGLLSFILQIFVFQKPNGCKRQEKSRPVLEKN